MVNHNAEQKQRVLQTFAIIKPGAFQMNFVSAHKDNRTDSHPEKKKKEES